MRIRISAGPVTAAVVLAASLAGAGWAAPAFAKIDPIPANPVVSGLEKVSETTSPAVRTAPIRCRASPARSPSVGVGT